MSEPLSRDAEREALEALLLSEGWRAYVAAMQTQWSPASYEKAIRDAMKTAEPGTDITPIVGQINATYSGMRQMLNWPQERLRVLKGETVKRSDPFAWAHRIRRKA